MKTIRTFIAIDIEPNLQNQLARGCLEMPPLNIRIKWTQPHNMHLTLKFLGECSPKQFRQITDTFIHLPEISPVFTGTISRMGYFPDHGPVRIIWAGFDDPDGHFFNIAGSLENTFAKLGFKKERRIFRPHITCGRVKSGPHHAHLKAHLDHFSFTPPLTQPIRKLTLYQSTLTSQGPVYTPHHTIHFQNLS